LKGVKNNIITINNNYYFKPDIHNKNLIEFNDYNLFNELLEYLSSLYLINFSTKRFRGLSKYHNFTRSNNFYNINKNNILYPENFITLNIENNVGVLLIENKKISAKLFNYNNEESPSKKKSTSLFENNNNLLPPSKKIPENKY